MKQWLIVGAFIAAMLVYMGFQQNAIDGLKQERDKYQTNTETLLTDIEHYRVNDSLNVARVGALELTLKEYKRFRADDAELIQSLRSKIKNLQNVTAAQLETILDLQAMPKDTVVIRDSIPVKAQSIKVHDNWFDFYGVYTNDNFVGRLFNRDSLLLTQYIEYKRFLGFLWKTGRIKDKQFNILSKNPHTQITGFEYIEIEQ